MILHHFKYSGRMSWDTESGSVVLANRHDIKFMDEKSDCYEIEIILGVLEIEDSSYLGVVRKGKHVCIYEGCEVFKILKIDFIPIIICVISEHIVNVKNFIESHDFYYTKDKFMEERFIWNMHMINKLAIEGQEWTIQHRPFREEKDYGYCFMFCGYFSSNSFKLTNEFYHIKLLSLVCARKIGTRFLSRGLDEEGNVSFFVKTQCVIKKNNRTLIDFIVLRGSVPLFWRQKNQGINGRLYFFGDEMECEKAFDKHFSSLTEEYGDIHVITLLGSRRDELALNLAYKSKLEANKIPNTDFDLNSHTANFDNLKNLFNRHLDSVKENAVCRVNCVDCLDRTNLAQYLICKYKVEKIIQNHTINKILQQAWTENGHSLANLYTGSDVMKSELSLNQKRSIFGLLDDFFISATRLINNRFTDKQKNRIINILLGRDDQN